MLRLRELRLENGLLQREVAQSIGVSPQSYGYYENGINKPDPDMLIKLADFFEVSIDYLLGRSDEYGNIYNDIDGTYSDEERQLIEDFRLLNHYKQELIKSNIKAMLPAEAESKQKKKGNS